jgi:hypothetical protein
MLEKEKILISINEINIEKGACVELYYAFGSWFIVSSDGLKQS